MAKLVSNAMLGVISASVAFMGGAVVTLASPVPAYECKVEQHAALKVRDKSYGENFYVGEFIYGDTENGFRLDAYPPQRNEKDGRQFYLDKTGATSFSNGEVTLVTSGSTASFVMPGGVVFPCGAGKDRSGDASVQKTSSQNTGILGQSLFGSIIRANADAGAKELDRIPQGEPLEVVSETGSFFDGWQWVKIRYSEGLEGFVWGGTICTTGKEVTGVHFGCN